MHLPRFFIFFFMTSFHGKMIVPKCPNDEVTFIGETLKWYSSSHGIEFTCLAQISQPPSLVPSQLSSLITCPSLQFCLWGLKGPKYLCSSLALDYVPPLCPAPDVSSEWNVLLSSSPANSCLALMLDALLQHPGHLPTLTLKNHRWVSSMIRDSVLLIFHLHDLQAQTWDSRNVC